MSAKRPKLLPGKSREVVRHNALALLGTGLSREESIRRALTYAGLRPQNEPSGEPPDVATWTVSPQQLEQLADDPRLSGPLARSILGSPNSAKLLTEGPTTANLNSLLNPILAPAPQTSSDED